MTNPRQGEASSADEDEGLRRLLAQEAAEAAASEAWARACAEDVDLLEVGAQVVDLGD